MLSTCSLVKIGASQNEHGWSPSRAQIIFPQFRQLGAVSKSGCIEALHVHFLLWFDRVGFVDTSKAAIAAVKSATFAVVVVVAVALWGVDVPD